MVKNLNLAWKLTTFAALLLSFIPSLAIVSLSLALLINFKNHLKKITQDRFNWIWAILSIFLILSSFFAAYPLEAFLGLPNLLPFILLLVSFRVLINQSSQLRQLAWLLVIPSFAITILGFGQLFGNWATPSIVHQLLGWRLVPHGEPAGRMSSVFMYANILAGYTVMVFFLNLGLWLEAFKFHRRDYFPLWFLSVSLVANGWTIILTSSRNAWAITFFGCLIFAFYLGLRLLVLGIVSAASTIIWAAYGRDPGGAMLRRVIPAYFWARISDEMYPDRPVATLRSTQWEFALNLSLQRPWFGWGSRNFTPLYQAKMHEFLGHPHNLFLMFAAESGIIFTIALSAMVAWILAQGVMLLKTWRDTEADKLIFFSYLIAFFACIAFNLFDVTLYDLRTNALGWLLLSAITGIVYGKRSSLDFN